MLFFHFSAVSVCFSPCLPPLPCPPNEATVSFCFEDIFNYTMLAKEKHNGILTSLLFSSVDSISATSPFRLQKESLKTPTCALKTYHLFLAFQTELYSRNTMSFCIPGNAFKDNMGETLALFISEWKCKSVHVLSVCPSA